MYGSNESKKETPTGATATERENLLIEMRQRLESLPASTSALSLELALDDAPALPRRGAEAPPPVPNPEQPEPASMPSIAIDPFDSVGLASNGAEVGSWIPASPNDPFAAGHVDPFRNNNSSPVDNDLPLAGRQIPDPFSRPRPFTDVPLQEDTPGFSAESPDPFTSDTNGPSPFARVDPSSPFGSEAPAVPTLAEPDDNSALFAPATEAEEAANDFPGLPFEDGVNPFKPVEPTATAISISSALADGPPPLPGAGDSTTDPPDEAAYTAWLVEWLAYAERYGDETPGDPDRV